MFIRIDANTLVNIDKIRTITESGRRTYLTLDDGSEISCVSDVMGQAEALSLKLLPSNPGWRVIALFEDEAGRDTPRYEDVMAWAATPNGLHPICYNTIEGGLLDLRNKLGHEGSYGTYTSRAIVQPCGAVTDWESLWFSESDYIEDFKEFVTKQKIQIKVVSK